MEASIATTAADIMTAPVVTVGPDTPVAEIAALLGRKAISAVPVVDNGGHVIGLVSEYDLLSKSGTIGTEIMTTSVISISADTLISDIRRLLIEQRIRRLPVVQDGRLAGIVSRSDLVGLLATEWACGVCGESFRGEHPPAHCPKCHAEGKRFSLQEQAPGP